jgi:hypothetical protein
LDSLKPKNQGSWGIDVVVVIDRHSLKRDFSDFALRCAQEYFISIVTTAGDIGYSDWGYPQMEYVYKHRDENGLYIMNIGDDDVMIEGIIPKMVEVLANNPLRPYMFQAELHPSSHRGNTETVTIWNDECRSIVRGNVTGQNLVVPNIPQFMGHMTDDYEFIRQTAEKWDYNVGWIPLVTCKCY